MLSGLTSLTDAQSQDLILRSTTSTVSNGKMMLSRWLVFLINLKPPLNLNTRFTVNLHFDDERELALPSSRMSAVD